MKVWEKIKPYLKIQLLIGIVVGGIVGYLYYHFIGCNTNSCSITSDPIKSVLFGALLGLIIAFPENKNKQKKEN